MIEYLGYAAGVLTTFSFVPQAYSIIKTGSARDVSLGMYLSLSVGLCFWIAYGIMKQSMPLILTNLITLSLAIVILYLKLRDKNSL